MSTLITASGIGTFFEPDAAVKNPTGQYRKKSASA